MLCAVIKNEGTLEAYFCRPRPTNAPMLNPPVLQMSYKMIDAHSSLVPAAIYFYIAFGKNTFTRTTHKCLCSIPRRGMRGCDFFHPHIELQRDRPVYLHVCLMVQNI